MFNAQHIQGEQKVSVHLLEVGYKRMYLRSQ